MVSAIVKSILLTALVTVFLPTAYTGQTDAGKLLVMRHASNNFDAAFDGLIGGLEDLVEVYDFRVDSGTTDAAVANQIDAKQPDMIVLMENLSVMKYIKYQESQPEGTIFPPAVILVTLYVEQLMPSMKNVMGISYEISGINSLGSLRYLVTSPVKRVGVVYSPYLEPFFLDQKRECASEEFELVGIRLERENLEPRAIKRALRQLLRKEKVDALWVLNDNKALTEKNITRGWYEVLRSCKKPILVGAENLLELGHLGVFPNHYTLGELAASLVHETYKNKWQLPEKKLRRPITVRRILNMKLAKPAKLKIRPAALLEMDIIVE